MYRILSIDGGGLLGTFPASFLAAIEAHIERPIGDFLDLIAGTSTGCIIAIGLGMGMRASDLLGASGRSPAKTLSMIRRRARVHGRRLAWRFGWQRSGDRSVLGCAVRASGGVAEPQRARV